MELCNRASPLVLPMWDARHNLPSRKSANNCAIWRWSLVSVSVWSLVTNSAACAAGSVPSLSRSSVTVALTGSVVNINISLQSVVMWGDTRTSELWTILDATWHYQCNNVQQDHPNMLGSIWIQIYKVTCAMVHLSHCQYFASWHFVVYIYWQLGERETDKNL